MQYMYDRKKWIDKQSIIYINAK